MPIKYNIDSKPNTSGRFLLEDGTELNIAEVLKEINSKLSVENEPIYLGKIDFSEFTAGGTVTKYFPKVLRRNVLKRALILFNSTDITISQQRITMNDSFIRETSRTAGSTATTSQVLGNNNCVQVVGGTPQQMAGNYGEILNAPVDSISIAFTVSAEAPTKGEIEIAIMEVLS